jgi:hypothetical protein
MMILSLLVFVFMSAPASAQNVFEGPIAKSLGGSGRAGLDSVDGAFLNPALVALLPKSELTAYYQDGTRTAGQHQTIYGLDMSENDKDVLFSGNIAYLRTRTTGLVNAPVDGEIWHGAFAKSFFDRLSVGLSVYHFQAKSDVFNTSEQWNGSLGAVFMILPKLGVSFVYDNPIHQGSHVPTEVRFLPQQSFGVYWGIPYNAKLRLDIVRPDDDNPGNRLDIRTAIESAVGEFFVFRLGGRFDEYEDQRFITAGLGFNGPNLKIDYGIEKNVSGVGGAVHSVDLRGSF